MLQRAYIIYQKADKMLTLPMGAGDREYWLSVRNSALTVIAWGK